MADAAFPTAKFPAYTTVQLNKWIAEGKDEAGHMAFEVARRAKVAEGDFSVMTAGERLRWARKNAA